MERLSPLGRDGAPPEPGSPARGGTLEEGLPELAPRGVGQLLDVATDSIKSRFAPCVGLAFLFWLPGQWLVRGLEPGGGDPLDPLLAFVAVPITVFVSLLVSAAVAVITYGTTLGRHVPMRAVLMRLAASMPAILATTVFSGVLIVTGIFACVLPGIFFAWRMLFAPTIVVLERVGPIQALRRSWALTRVGVSRWLATVIVTYFYMAPFTVVVYKSEPFLQDLVPVASPEFIAGLSLALESFMLAVSSAFYGVLVTVLYVDARVRIEALDLDLRFERIVASRSSAASAPAARPHGGLA